MTQNTTTTDAFLSGEGVPVNLHDIETELIRLWGPAAERAGGPVPDQPIHDRNMGSCTAEPFTFSGERHHA